ncbi:MAG: hypothetical protein EXR98_20035 [Gemmataceae bacterium]|nr:hypothetical protein [Gemmataceae bacterium]
MQMWMIQTVETELEWPAQETTVSFMGQTLILRPPEGNSAADIRLLYETEDSQAIREGYGTICRFLSALSWRHRRPARTRLHFACTAPMRGGKGGFGPAMRKDYFLSDDLQSPSDAKACLAVALHREAMSVNSIPYEFLGYFKIINVRYSGGEIIIGWINKALPLLREKRATDRIAKLATSTANIGEYLYGSGRCAVAHAFSGDVVNPDNPDDLLRLAEDMPVARALAEYLIETEMGICWEGSR